MRDMGLQGCRRGRAWVRTTDGDDRLDRPADLVERQFRAPAPNRLWVADLTYVKTHIRLGVRGVHHRRVLPDGRRLASVAIAALGPGDRRARDGRVQPATRRRRPVRADPSQRPRRAIPLRSLLPAARRQRHRRVGRIQGRQLRQRDGRVVQRALQVGADLPARARGAASTTSSSPPSPTSTGSTTAASTARSNPAPATPPRPPSRPPTTVNTVPADQAETQSPEPLRNPGRFSDGLPVRHHRRRPHPEDVERDRRVPLANAWRSRSIAPSTPTASLPSSIASPPNAGPRRSTCASTTAPSSSPTPSRTGAGSTTPDHCSSTPAAHGRTPGSSPSTADSATSCSTGGASTPSSRPA